MEKRIKAYSIILALVYFGIIIYGLYVGVDSFKAGFNLNRDTAGQKKEFEIRHFKVEPKSGAYTYPESAVNNKTGEQVKLEVREYTVFMAVPPGSHSAFSIFISVAQIFFSLLFLFIFIFIPVVFFKIIRAIIKGDILNKKNIKRVTLIGWMLVAYYIMNLLLYNVGEVYITKQILQLENYKIIIDFSDTTALILGLVTLLFGEILRLSLRLKEEQDLTI